MIRVILLLSLSNLLGCEALVADITTYIIGNVTQIDWFHDSCTFTINEKDSPSLVPNYRLCKILEQAYMRSQGVVVDVKENANKFSYSVNFANRAASWANTKVENESFQYQMFGVVEDVYYHKDDKCYIAIDTGYASVRNNKDFHLTMVWDLCVKAVNAFYSREKVLMIGNVDLHTAYTNDIVDLQVLNC